jgi:hypothetical protein
MVGDRRPEQKIDRTLRQAKTSFAEEFREFPPVVSLFEDDSDARFAAHMRAIGVVVGNYDPDRGREAAAAYEAEQRFGSRL